MRFSHIVLAYAVMGMVMWGGGAIAWADSGVATLIVDDPATDSVNTETSDQLRELGGPIQEAAATVEGTGLLAAWNVIVKILGFLFWPIVTLQSIGAPARVWVLFGGTPTVAFWVSAVRIIRSSA